MQSLFSSKAGRYGLSLLAVLVLVGAAKLASNSSPADANPDTQLAETEALLKSAYSEGAQQGVKDTVAGNPDALTLQAAAQMDAALEQSQGDINALVCARSAQYLKSSADFAQQRQTNAEAWLRSQLQRENAAVKVLLTQYGALSGSSQQVSLASNPLINRAAIIMALQNIGGVVSCRVAPYESASAIDSAIYTANRIDANREQWAAQPAPPPDQSTGTEVTSNDSK